MLEISTTNQIIGSTYSSIVPNIYDRFKNERDAEIFERLVLDLMLNKYSDDKELTDYILALPRDKQRLAVLAVIDGDNVLWSKMNSFVNGCSDKFEHVKDVIKIINQFVKDGEVEKKEFGEVMTPISLVREMLDTLPKEVWSNPNLKWLDPCNGAGTFPFVVVYKLMVGLKEEIKDVELRYKHIVENMIYTCELQSRNVFLWLCGIDPKDEYTTNTYWGSFLDESFDYHMKNVWGVDKFDIVIGNPPYQRNLHLDFLKKGFHISNDFVLMVHPNSWLIDEKNHTKVYLETKDLIKNNLSKCIFINPNKEFGIKLSSPCTITLVDKQNVFDKITIDDKVNNNICYYNDISNINKWNNSDEYSSLKIKIDNYIRLNSNLVSKFGNNNLQYYINIARVRGNIDNGYDKLYSDDFFTILPKDELVKEDFTKAFCLNFSNLEYAKNCMDYLKTDIVRFCYSINKNDLSNNKIDMLRIPYVDFSKKWTDDMLISEFGISEKEFLFIKSIIPKYY
jgi:hypothetical protein